MKNSIYFILILLVGCKSVEQKTVKNELTLSTVNYNKIKNDSQIISDLYLTIQDSIEIKKIRKLLDNYFENNKRDDLITVLEIYRVFGDEVQVLAKDSLDKDNFLKIESYEDLKKLKESLSKTIILNRVNDTIITQINKD
ncbi:hypothetical protein ES677_14510 [Bizionia gelidisalsuginis]|uniref:Uncharacterized protein n=2 Tax=Bizionia TaxID=283785 RepID=A0A8H2QKA3_9FLAO|nr:MULTISPECIES: hypothetical protein [Bizionia]TYB69074.1 hypothetical protein ES676_14275 [Bizionia saleffrena]TYC08417.1 hypothetical protein ES677_14510 [Bizionia gelidisalsuginis]